MSSRRSVFSPRHNQSSFASALGISKRSFHVAKALSLGCFYVKMAVFGKAVLRQY